MVDDKSPRYRRGSVIRQAAPHPQHPSGARRWRVLDVEGSDYYVRALFSDGSPGYAYWDTDLCDAATELEWQDNETGRIDHEGRCTSWVPGREKR